MKLQELTHIATKIEKVLTTQSGDVKPDLEKVLTEALDWMSAKVSETEEAVMHYNAILALCDFPGISRDTYEQVSLSHARVLRAFCQQRRNNAVFTDAQTSKVVAGAFSRGIDGHGAIAGVRKSIRTSTNIGVMSQWLSLDEMRSALMSACTWSAPSASMALDAGFMVFCGNKFDVDKAAYVKGINAKDLNDDSGMTPAEFGVIMRHLIQHLVKVSGVNATVAFIEKVGQRTVDNASRLAGFSQVYETINKYAIEVGIKLGKASKSEELTSALSSAKDTTMFAGTKVAAIPANASIGFGLELLYCYAPTLSRVWCEILTREETSLPRIGFMDNLSLYHGYYNVTPTSRLRLLPVASVTFVVSSDQPTTDKIIQTSASRVLGVGYTWKYERSDDNRSVEFTLDDILENKGLLEAGKTYVVSPRFLDATSAPFQTGTYRVTDVKPFDVNKLPGKLKAGSLVMAILTEDRNTVGWGVPLTQTEAAQVLGGLEFEAGQEMDIGKQSQTLCRVTVKPCAAVSKALNAQNSQYALFVVNGM